MKNIFFVKISPNRVYGLDILRALAIGFVLFSHGTKLITTGIKRFFYALSFDGVTFFFVLSGFLVGGILIRKLEQNEFSWKALSDFWIRRWFRTIPVYYFVLVITFVVKCIILNNFTDVSLLSYLTFSQNFFSEGTSGFFPEAWSLSVEEWFYLLVPILTLVFIFFLKIPPKYSILLSAIIIIGLTTYCRYYKYLQDTTSNPFGTYSMYARTVSTRLDSLMYGVLGAYLFYYHKKKFLSHKKAFLIVGILLIVFFRIIYNKWMVINFELFMCVFLYSLTPIAILCLIPYLSDLKSGSGWVYRIITTVSMISYSVYLLNLPVLDFIIENLSYSGNDKFLRYTIILVQYLLFLFITFLLSFLLNKYIEIPTTNFREKFRSFKISNYLS